MGLESNLDDIAITCNSNFQFHLLFNRLPKRPTAEQLKNKLSIFFGDVTTVINEDELMAFSLEDYPIPYSENRLKTKLVMTETFPYELKQIEKINPDLVNHDSINSDILESIHYTILITDMLASSLDYKVRCKILVNWIKIAVQQLDETIAVWIPSAKKIISADEIIKRTSNDLLEFLFLGVNIRVFSTAIKDEYIVDTLGMNAIGQCDVEYCFRGVDIQVAVEYAYYIASEILKHSEVMENVEHLANNNKTSKIGAEWKLELSNSSYPPTRKLVKVKAV